MDFDKPKHYVTDERAEYQAEIFGNRLKKQYKHLARRFRRRNIDVFRLYDRDIAEVRAVVDWYAGHLVIGEYTRLQTGPNWLPRMARAASEALDVPMDKVFIKQRTTKVGEGGPRYRPSTKKGDRFIVNEMDLQFWINLDGQLDTGLFSDHRITRTLMRDMAKDQDFLNLFAYTGAFSCAAALGGARSMVTVDRSATYIQWAQDNLALNKLTHPAFRFVKADVEGYLDELIKIGEKFTLAFVDPPSFSQRRGGGEAGFDINRHHPELLAKVFQVMAPNSTVIFSNNHQRFEPKFDSLDVKKIIELTPKTIPEDYRNKNVHRCWKFEL